MSIKACLLYTACNSTFSRQSSRVLPKF